jgi:hypothetical protein
VTSYTEQGKYPLPEAMTAIVILKDRQAKSYIDNVIVFNGEPMALSWGLWEVPDADNDEKIEDGPEAA